MVHEEDIQQAVRCLKALAHPTRISILCHLRDGEKTVYELQTLLACTQSNVSQHLSIMRERGILITRKEANQVYYAVKNPEMFRLLDVVQDVYCQAQKHQD
jgi:DNA-binding transcriptional ArsR family regulator